MSPNQADFARDIIRELVAEADNQHLPETLAVMWARTWLEVDKREAQEPTPCKVCQEYHDRYISAYPDRAKTIGRDWDSHIAKAHPRKVGRT